MPFLTVKINYYFFSPSILRAAALRSSFTLLCSWVFADPAESVRLRHQHARYVFIGVKRTKLDTKYCTLYNVLSRNPGRRLAIEGTIRSVQSVFCHEAWTRNPGHSPAEILRKRYCNTCTGFSQIFLNASVFFLRIFSNIVSS